MERANEASVCSLGYILIIISKLRPHTIILGNAPIMLEKSVNLLLTTDFVFLYCGFVSFVISQTNAHVAAAVAGTLNSRTPVKFNIDCTGLRSVVVCACSVGFGCLVPVALNVISFTLRISCKPSSIDAWSSVFQGYIARAGVNKMQR